MAVHQAAMTHRGLCMSRVDTHSISTLTGIARSLTEIGKNMGGQMATRGMDEYSAQTHRLIYNTNHLHEIHTTLSAAHTGLCGYFVAKTNYRLT